MEKYVVIVRDGMFLGKAESDDTVLKMSLSYYDISNKALRVPLDAYENEEEVQEQVQEIAQVASGEVVVLSILETVETLDGDVIDVDKLRAEQREEKVKSDISDFMRDLFRDEEC